MLPPLARLPIGNGRRGAWGATVFVLAFLPTVGSQARWNAADADTASAAMGSRSVSNPAPSLERDVFAPNRAAGLTGIGSDDLGRDPAQDPASTSGNRTLDEARARTAALAATLDGLKRSAQPGHLLEPVEDGAGGSGIESLRGQCNTLQFKAESLKATLGDHHPDLVAAEAALADVRQQLQAAIKTAIAATERQLGDARAAEHRLAAGDADVTGATAPRPLRSSATRSTSLEDPRVQVASAPALPTTDEVGTRPRSDDRSADVAEQPDPDRLVTALAAAGLAGLAALWAFLARPSPRRLRTVPKSVRAVVAAEDRAGLDEESQGSDTVADLAEVPLLATTSCPARAGAAYGVSVLDRDPASLMAQSATLIATLLQATRVAERVSVLVTPLVDLGGTEALAASIAAADAATGRRVLLMDARPSGRLRPALVPRRPATLLLEFGTVVRPAYRLDRDGTALCVLPNDPGEAEAVRRAAAGATVSRQSGFSGFDTVVVIGSGVQQDAGDIASGADLVLIAAPVGTSAAELSAAARTLQADRDRPCGAVLLTTEAAGVAAASPGPGASLPQRDGAAPVSAASRLAHQGSQSSPKRVDHDGLRSTFDAQDERLRA